MEEEQQIPLSPSKTGNKRVQEYDDDYEPGTESDESDEYYNPPEGYSVLCTYRKGEFTSERT
jgi:hypothetical protein